MSTPRSTSGLADGTGGGQAPAAYEARMPAPPTAGPGAPLTYAAFSPTATNLSTRSGGGGTSTAASKRSTILVHQKSPLLLATPPQITRALAYSHPFILPLNKLAGLLSWTTGDPWESFLVLCAFWAVALYGDVVVRLAGPMVVVVVLILGMYSRRFSPLSSSAYGEAAFVRADSGLSGSGVGGTGGGGGGGGGGGVVGSAGAGSAAGAGGKQHKRGGSAVVAGAAGGGTSGGGGSGGGPGGGGPGASTQNAALGSAPGGLDGQAGSSARAAAHRRTASSLSAEATSTRHQKTLDSMVATLREFTHRCDVLLEPLLELTDFLSTQRTPTTASTRPALTTLFVRILFCTPFWMALTLPPLRIITTRRVVLVVGTIALTWHARVMRVARTIVWRSITVRKLAGLVTGLQFEIAQRPGATADGDAKAKDGAGSDGAAATAATAATGAQVSESELGKALRRRATSQVKKDGPQRGGRGDRPTGVRFTFIIYENQRRWIGLGWTSSLFAYERTAWTDEHNNAVPQRDDFELPSAEDTGGSAHTRWRWVKGSKWRVDGVPDAPAGEEVDYDGDAGRMGWIYYDNKWQNGRRGQDGWGRWTRRRKWYRDAELVEMGEDDDQDASSDENAQHTPPSSSTIASTQPSAHAPMMAVSPTQPNFPRGAADGGASSSDARSTGTAEHAEEGAVAVAAAKDKDKDKPPESAADDSASLLSSSSRSARFFKSSPAPPALSTGAPGAAPTPTGAGAAVDRKGSLRRKDAQQSQSQSQSQSRSRRASEAASTADNEAAALDPALELEIQGSGREGGKWGIGDEARMGLE